MSNYEIIKKVFGITQREIKGDTWEKRYEWEKMIKEIEGVIADERPTITGPKWKEVK